MDDSLFEKKPIEYQIVKRPFENVDINLSYSFIKGCVVSHTMLNGITGLQSILEMIYNETETNTGALKLIDYNRQIYKYRATDGSYKKCGNDYIALTIKGLLIHILCVFMKNCKDQIIINYTMKIISELTDKKIKKILRNTSFK